MAFNNIDQYIFYIKKNQHNNSETEQANSSLKVTKRAPRGSLCRQRDGHRRVL